MSAPFLLTQPPQANQAPESDLSTCRALIIDTNQTSRSILRSMLADLGLHAIAQAAKVSDARRALENRTFDVVLCDYHFDDCSMTGADLLDDLRRAQLLPYSTVFVMVTGEASYVRVAEAAESALDSYLLKPHNVNTLAERLHLARHRKIVLGSIFEAIEREDFALASQLCMDRYEARGEYWVYAARIGGELLLRLGRHDEARVLFKAIHETKALPWARLGIARAQLDGGQPTPARLTLQSLISDNPAYADAYDVMGRAQLQAGQFADAMRTYQRAVSITPASIGRLQKVGMLAYYLGDNEEAMKTLERAASLGVSSKMFDFQSLVMLAQMRFEQRDYKGVQRCLHNLAHAFERRPNNIRLRRMNEVVGVLELILQRQPGEALKLVNAMPTEFNAADYDFEAAGNMMGLLVRLKDGGFDLPESGTWVRQLASRFCTSKISMDMLAMSTSQHQPYCDLIRQAYKDIGELAENALTHAKSGTPVKAVKTLLVHGAKTNNAKLLDLADMVLQRYREQIADASNIDSLIQELRTRYCRHSTQVQLGAGSGRQAGGLNLRS
jgi:CheY-like chemotaxis protein